MLSRQQATAVGSLVPGLAELSLVGEREQAGSLVTAQQSRMLTLTVKEVDPCGGQRAAKATSYR